MQGTAAEAEHDRMHHIMVKNKAVGDFSPPPGTWCINQIVVHNLPSSISNVVHSLYPQHLILDDRSILLIHLYRKVRDYETMIHYSVWSLQYSFRNSFAEMNTEYWILNNEGYKAKILPNVIDRIFALVRPTGFPACGRAGSRGKRAPGTFSNTAPFESLWSNAKSRHPWGGIGILSMGYGKDGSAVLIDGFELTENKWNISQTLDVISFADANCDIFVFRRMRYDINPPMPAGISLAVDEFHTQSVYRKSTQWIYIVEKTSS